MKLTLRLAFFVPVTVYEIARSFFTVPFSRFREKTRLSSSLCLYLQSFFPYAVVKVQIAASGWVTQNSVVL